MRNDESQNPTRPGILLSVKQVARELAVGEETLRKRVDKAEILSDFVVISGLRGPMPLFRPDRVQDIAAALGIARPAPVTV